MSDGRLCMEWVGILLGGLAIAAGLRSLGLSRTYVRDVLHVGAGIWPLGWLHWHAALAPLAIVWGAFLAMAALPLAGRHVAGLARLQDGVSGEGEGWSGLVLYTASVAVLTTVGLFHAPFPAAAALLALALGDGLGGAVGLAFGRLRYRVPGAKQKSLEGTLAVALFSTCGVLLAAFWFGVPLSLVVAVEAGVLAAVAEAVSPRASDNVVLPACVWGFLVATQI